MEINLLRAVKYRVMDELRYAVQEHQNFRDKVRVYHKFPYKERPPIGVVLTNASSTRTKLSPDDHAGTLKSHVALARAENREDNFLEWAWEDRFHTTDVQVNEDVSNQTQGTSSFGTNRVFYVQHKPIVSGRNNTKIADNFRQIKVTVNGELIHAEFVDGKDGLVMLPTAPAVGDEVLISYYYSLVTPPGRYYIEMISSTQFVIDPLYVIDTEKVIDRTTGTEMTAQLDNGNLYGDFDVLYTMKTKYSNKIYLEKGTDYTLDTSGLITFLNPLPVDTTLFADYRWVGDRLGPFDVPGEFQHQNTALPGIVLAFSNQLDPGSRMVLIVYKQREAAASVFSGHYNMSFDIDVFARDPQQLADLTDQVVNDVWNNRRLKLIDEGLTITELDPTGESEDVYDSNTGDLYYKNSVRMDMMSEWKKFVPALYEIKDYNTKLYRYFKTHDYIVTKQNQILELRLIPYTKTFEVKYPKAGYPRYF